MIPKKIHFVFGLEKDFGKKPFSIVHYIAIKSAIEINQPEAAFLYYKFEPTGIWWQRVLKENLVKLVPISAPQKIFGNKLYHYAHKSDIVRLALLRETGGIYLDIDTICIKAFDDLLGYQTVMALELLNASEHGLCNAVILAAQNSEFLGYWLGSYKKFRSKGRDQFWAEHSVRVPLRIAKQYPHTIHIEPECSFFYPSYTSENLKMLFEETKEFPHAYLYHLWESLSYDKYLTNFTEESIKQIDTTYNIQARKFL